MPQTNNSINNMPNWWGFYIILFIALCVFIGGVKLTYNTAKFLNTALQTNGVVLDFYSTTSSNTNNSSTSYTTVHYPVVQFTPVGKRTTVRFQHNYGSDNPAYSKGDNVKVLYAPDNPYDAVIEEGLGIWIGPFVLLLLGGIVSAFTAVYLYKKHTAEYRNRKTRLRYD